MAKKKNKAEDNFDQSNVIGNRLRELRNAKGLSQQDLADNVDIKRSTYSAYETGNQEMKASHIRAITEFYGISYDALLYDPAYDNPYNVHKAVYYMNLLDDDLAVIITVRDHLEQKNEK